jgi:hypothetical protein
MLQRLLLGDGDDFATAIVAAGRTHAMREHELLAVGARLEIRRGDSVVVRASLVAPRR